MSSPNPNQMLFYVGARRNGGPCHLIPFTFTWPTYPNEMSRLRERLFHADLQQWPMAITLAKKGKRGLPWWLQPNDALHLAIDISDLPPSGDNALIASLEFPSVRRGGAITISTEAYDAFCQGHRSAAALKWGFGLNERDREIETESAIDTWLETGEVALPLLADYPCALSFALYQDGVDKLKTLDGLLGPAALQAYRLWTPGASGKHFAFEGNLESIHDVEILNLLESRLDLSSLRFSSPLRMTKAIQHGRTDTLSKAASLNFRFSRFMLADAALSNQPACFDVIAKKVGSQPTSKDTVWAFLEEVLLAEPALHYLDTMLDAGVLSAHAEETVKVALAHNMSPAVRAHCITALATRGMLSRDLAFAAMDVATFQGFVECVDALIATGMDFPEDKFWFRYEKDRMAFIGQTAMVIKPGSPGNLDRQATGIAAFLSARGAVPESWLTPERSLATLCSGAREGKNALSVMVSAYIRLGKLPDETLGAHCTNSELLTLMLSHHPDPMRLLQHLPEAFQVKAMDATMAL